MHNGQQMLAASKVTLRVRSRLLHSHTSIHSSCRGDIQNPAFLDQVVSGWTNSPFATNGIRQPKGDEAPASVSPPAQASGLETVNGGEHSVPRYLPEHTTPVGVTNALPAGIVPADALCKQNPFQNCCTGAVSTGLLHPLNFAFYSYTIPSFSAKWS